jgi:hypothetical protein
MNSEQQAGDKAAYRGKKFSIPTFTTRGGVRFRGDARQNKIIIPTESPIIQSLNQPFDLKNFKTPRRPVSLGLLTPEEMRILSTPSLAGPRTLDLPIKFPGSDGRLPAELAMYESIARRVFNYARAINPRCFDEYYCYFTADAGWVKPGQLQREAPCHVDGFQGARWRPKVRGNHTFTVSNAVPTAYYEQVFDFDLLDEAVHDFFWEMNRQVSLTNGVHAWYPADGEMTLMDCYSVHRGTIARRRLFRTFLRFSFEVRIFDRLGNAHNPLFQYDWPMVPRDIEALNLVAFDPTCDPSLRVFPWQNPDGTAIAPGSAKTQPNLTPAGVSSPKE